MTERYDPINTTSHKGPEYRRRWHPIKNMTYETIPSFAIVMLKQDDRDGFFTHNVVDGQMVYRVWQCNSDGENSGEPYLFMMNGPVPIPPQKIGRGTQDFPCLVLHDGNDDRLPNGTTCGPVSGSWYVWSTGNGFVCKSHDDCRAYPNTDGIHTVEVAPSVQGQKDVGCVNGGSTASANAVIELTPPDADIAGSRSIEWDSSVNGWAISRSGIFMVAVSATINASLSVAEATVLRLQCYLDDDAIAHLTGHRLHCIDTVGPGDPYYGGAGYATAENVAFCAPVFIDEATPDSRKVLYLKNASGVEIVVADGLFTVWPVSFKPTATGKLTYT